MNSQHSVGKSVFLHLFPGLLSIVAFVALSHILADSTFPPLLILNIALCAGVLPFELGVLFYRGRKEKTGIFSRSVIPFTVRLNWKEYIIPVAVSFFWPVLVFTTFGPAINDFLKDVTFPWLPDYFELGAYIRTPQLYPRNIRIITWVVTLILGVFIGPAIEEMYFHGYLLSRLSRFRQVSVLISSVLFAAYHFWSPHLVVTRIIALLPLVYFVWKKKNILIGIIAHCALNLAGDALFAIPAAFG